MDLNLWGESPVQLNPVNAYDINKSTVRRQVGQP